MGPAHVHIQGSEDLHLTGPKKALYTQSQSGHIDSELYLEYIKHIEPLLNPERPVVILQDNHSCHENSALIEFCLAKQIHIFNFPPKVTHLIQPLDKLSLTILKTYFNKSETTPSSLNKAIFLNPKS